MLIVEAKLAQEIVDRTMKIIPFNVNVMDARGIILGSGEAFRIGSLHDGAQLALAQQRTVEIDSATMSHLHGVKPGVNLPLSVRGQICGVVGLTGDPEAVRQFGELVRVTAEMILEQAQLIGELQRERRYREEFLFQLVKGGISRTELEAWAIRIGVEFSCPRVVVILNLLNESLRPDLALIELQHCQTQLAENRPELLTALISHRELVILDSFDLSGIRVTKPAFARQRLVALDLALRDTLKTPAAMSMGVALTGIEGVALSYQSALRTLRVGRLRNLHETLFSFYDLSLPVLLAGLDFGWQAEQFRQPLQRLGTSGKRGALLRRTLGVWFAQNGHPVATAKALRIHRNTLDYRLRTIGDLTGLNLENTDDRLLLYIALQLE